MNLSENDKIWFVVLVASNKIVTPLLRKLVPKGIEKLRDFLNDRLQNISTPCNIQTLTHSIYREDPYLKRLRFGNINDNDKVEMKEDYDYSINSLVDLAKLHLPNYLAKFAAFDKSLEMAAVLRLLGYELYPFKVFESPNPSLDITSLANDVRESVRNPVSHYNEDNFTEHFLNKSFEKLMALVKAVVLPEDQVSDVLDQLHKWQKNGTVSSVLI